ncbi:g6131 [Coccomyxa elongata]
MSEEEVSSVRWTLMAGLIGAGGGVLAWTSARHLAFCNGADPPTTQASHEGLKIFRSWLQSHGAQIDTIAVAPGSQGAGLVMQLSRKPAELCSWRAWIWNLFRPQQDIVLARFQLSTAITSKLITSQPGVQLLYRQLLETNTCDERLLTMLFLIVEKLRGESSKLAPWIAVLPDSFDMPLHYSDEEIAQLQGTTLHNATRILKQNLLLKWEHLEPICEDLLGRIGAKDAKATFADFLWAYSTFWSRAQTFPDPSGEGQGQAVEGIVPGLDFCNHDFAAASRWTVFGARTGGEEAPTCISLVARRRDVPRVGEEVSISYGDKSNEELLLLYGFTVDDNPHDMLMLRCPLLPMAEWNEVLKARVALLQRRGLSPQLFLHAAGIRGAQGIKGERGNAADRLQQLMPEAAWGTLEVLVMEPRQLAQELEAGAGPTSQQPSPPSTPVEAAGLRLAVMTTLVRLLEVKLAELEGEGGTGSLENDVQLLEGPLSRPGGQAHRRLRDCVVYRAGQKRIVRGYLQIARTAVMEELERMQHLLRDAEE